ncbi:hypothetical protein [Nitrospira sp. BLG_2]|uniref:hypothetical protein n=1 Tax=Nitrospira sp. BLG_2 TaxID=3397507 RepID=UPI003B9A218F
MTERCAGLIELKAFNRPVEGGINGEWSLVLPDGSRKKIHLPNPHEQVVQRKFALSDEVRKPVAVFHERMTHIAKFRLAALRLAV